MPASQRTSGALVWQSIRKHLRFGLRTLLVVVTVLALGLGWLVRRVERQRAAVAQIERSGGHVVFAHEYAHRQAQLKAGTFGRNSPQAPPPGPPWLRRWLSPHYFQQVENVYLHPSEAGDGAAWPLSDLPGAKCLLLSGGRVGEPQLRSIGEARSLEELHLINCELDERGIGHLANLHKLRHIDIELGSFTAKGFQQLCQIPHVTNLTLLGTKTEPAGFASLPSFRKLRWLDVLNVEMRDEHVDSIAKMPGLEFVRLLGTAITSDGIERLRSQRPKLEITFIEEKVAADSSDE
jgi:hypothetical protein